MESIIILFRGINVGGNNIIQMKDLTGLLLKLGLKNIKTYIQSGNVIAYAGDADTGHIRTAVTSAVMKERGFEPKIIILQKDEFEAVMKNNPFPEAESDPKALHIGFLSEQPDNPDIKKMDAVKKETERYRIIGKAFYLYAPEGIGRSKLASESERLLGVQLTDRNWRTVKKIRDMLADT